MADYFPFDSGQGSNVTEAQWGLMAQNWLGTGVLKGKLNELLAYADSTGMQVKVKSGQAWVQGFFFQVVTESIIPISPANSTNPRIDRIAVQVDWTNNNISLIAIQGTPASNPTPPALTQNTSIWQISLAQVLVGANVSTIVAGNVTDERVFTGKSAMTANFNVRGLSWGAISVAGTLNAFPLTGGTISGSYFNGFHIGSKYNAYDLVCDVPGRYLVSVKSLLSGLNNLQTADITIRIYKADNSGYGDDGQGIYGWSGLGSNYDAPYGIPLNADRVCDLSIGDRLVIYVRCTEAPRNINGYYIIGERIA